jgi:hypothetical protein
VGFTRSTLGMLFVAGTSGAQCLTTLSAVDSLATGSQIGEIRIADFDNDGQADIAWVNDTTGTLGIAFADGSGSYALQEIATVPGGAALEVSDLDDDGNADIALGSVSDTDLTLLYGRGDGTFDTVQVSLPESNARITIGDFTADGLNDIVVGHYSPTDSDITPIIGTGNRAFTVLPQIDTAAFLSYLDLGDLNGDGLPDLVVGTQNSQTIEFYLGDGLGGFTPSFSDQLAGNIRFVQIVDVNLDGNADVVFTAQQEDSLWTYLGDGAGGVASTLRTPVPQANAVRVTDFDDDGIPDCFVTRSNGGIDSFQGLGDGSFALVDSTPLTGVLNSLAVGDLNNDGRVDAVVHQRAEGTIRVFENLCDPVSIDVQPIACQLIDLPSSFVEIGVSTSEPGATYQWRFEGEPLANSFGVTGTTTDTLTILPDAFREGRYDVIVSNGTAQAISDPSLLAIRYQPADQNGDGQVTPGDFNAWIVNFNLGRN